MIKIENPIEFPIRNFCYKTRKIVKIFSFIILLLKWFEKYLGFCGKSPHCASEGLASNCLICKFMKKFFEKKSISFDL